MESKCVVCHDKPSQFRCIQCHKPVCDDCAFKTEQGAFCSRDCAGAYRSFKGSVAGRKKGAGGLVKLIIVILAVLAAAAVAYKMGLIPCAGGAP